ncbi:hypothetical protein ACPPVO_22230 [Dactylosporangium sp. McL0621]|uniref:hypothetical protein n=1 Tax=Dactylosporangium sp. McL0621 TaxID=3415678 RepID=UPI003CE6A843
MRKLLAVLCGATLLVAGCNDASGTSQAGSSTSPSAAASPPPSVSPSASPSSLPVDPAVVANTRQVCDELKRVMEDQTVAFLAAVSRYGNAATITDPAKKAAVVETAKKSFTTWAKAVRALSTKAKDPALRKVIDDQAAALDDTAATLTSLDQLTSASGGMSSPPMQVAASETTEVCG